MRGRREEGFFEGDGVGVVVRNRDVFVEKVVARLYVGTVEGISEDLFDGSWYEGNRVGTLVAFTVRVFEETNFGYDVKILARIGVG